jgi:hypothetical protein
MAGTVRIPSLGIDKFPVTFLVDTGSDDTVLMPIDIKRICIDHGFTHEKIEDLGKEDESYGSAGKSVDFLFPGHVTFRGEDGVSYSWSVDFRLPRITDDILGLPSLLGRDVMKHWRTTFDPKNKLLEFEIHRYDKIHPQPKK